MALGLTAGVYCASALPAAANTWIKAETEHFVIYSTNGESKTRDYASRLESFYKIADAFYGRLSQTQVADDNKAVFYYFGNVSAYRTVKPKIDTGAMIIDLSCRDGATHFWSADEGMGDDVSQEYQFESVTQILGNSYDAQDMPKWLSKGLYLYLLTAEIKDGTVILGAPSHYQFTYYRGMLDEPVSLMGKNDRIPYAEVISGKYSNPQKTESLPGQSWIITHYMLTDPNNLLKLYDYIDKFNAGMPSLDAWQAATRIDPTVFDGVTLDYMTKGVPVVTYKFQPLPAADVTIAPLGSYAEDVPLLSAAAQTCPADGDGARIETRLQTAASAAPDDLYVQRELARAQVLFDTDPGKAVPWLQGRIAADAADHDAHYLLGRAFLRQAQAGGNAAGYSKARGELGKAYTLNTTYAPGLYYYAKSFADTADYPNDNTLNAAEAAFDLVKDSDYRFYLAELYVRREMFDDAKSLLEPFLNPASKANGAVVARMITDAIDAKKPKDQIVALFAQFSEYPNEPYKKPA